jgi:hypothetical protein
LTAAAGDCTGRVLERRVELRVAQSVVAGIDIGTSYGCVAVATAEGVVRAIPLGTRAGDVCMPMAFGFHASRAGAVRGAALVAGCILTAFFAQCRCKSDCHEPTTTRLSCTSRR